MDGYILDLGGHTFDRIHVYRILVTTSRNNARRVPCVDCGERLEPGTGIHLHMYKRNGFRCLACIAEVLTVATRKAGGMDAGFRYNKPFDMLTACVFDAPDWTTPQVIAAIQPIKSPADRESAGGVLLSARKNDAAFIIRGIQTQ